MEPEEERQLAVDLFNHVWDLMEKTDRTLEEDDEMIHAAHASCYHWGRAGKPENRARGEWQVSRMYTVLGRGGAALFHANRCLEICERYGISDWDKAYAFEALSRAHKVARHIADAKAYKKLAREWGDRIKDREDRDQFDKDYLTL